MITHSSLEKGMWRGWFEDGQSIEITWPLTFIGARFLYSSDDYGGTRMIWVGLGFIQFYIPLGRTSFEHPVGDEPSWGVDLSCEYGVVVHWGKSYHSWRWPFHVIPLERRENARSETHPYTYTLRSGKVQNRKATIVLERWEWGRHILSLVGWPTRVEYTIDVKFDGEVGEETGSWKGGCVGCSYTLLSGESSLAALRRMERERKF